jgi:recombinational DNA repair ATPase RecF
MNLVELEIHNIRGIKELKLPINENSFVIYGPNGSGKSAVVDSIDFLLTGDISRFKGEGTKDLNLQVHGPHIDHTPEEATVRGVIKIPGLDKLVEIKRCIANPKKLEFENEFKETLAPIIDLAKRGQYILTRREILRYITAQPNDRATAIQTLLNIKEIENIRKRLVKIRGDFLKEFDTAKSKLEDHKMAIVETIQSTSFDERIILDFINENRKLLSGAPLSSLDWQELEKGITEPAEIIKKDVFSSTLIEKRIQELLQVLSDENKKQVAKLDENLRDYIIKIEEKPELIQEINRIKLTQMGLKFIDKTGNCPLCDIEWEEGKLEKKLTERLKLAEQLKKMNEEVEYLSQELSREIKNTISKLNEFTEILDNLEMKDYIQIFETWKKDLGELGKILDDPLSNYISSDFKQEDILVLLAPEKLNEILDNIQIEIKDILPKDTPEIAAWKNLLRLEEDLKLYESARAKYLLTQKYYDKAELLSNSFIKAKDTILGNLYNEIKKRFEELYKKLHGEEESNFTSKLEPEGPALRFEVEFHGHGTYPPHALHSEGHQDSMGLCLYLALAERVNASIINLLVLDDVVMSVDTGHRKKLCTVIKTCFPNKQFLLTTHDKIWKNQLKAERVVANENIIEFSKWKLDSGPLSVKFDSDIWNRLDKDLTVDHDVRAAAARLRNFLEQFFASVCHELQAPVVFKLDGEYELGNFMYSARDKYKKLLDRIKRSARSWGDEENIPKKIDEMHSIRSQRYEASQIEQWAINTAVHYNEWENFTETEFQNVVDAFNNLCELFVCSKCGKFIRVVDVRNKPDSLRCDCGTVNFNLVMKT